MKPCLVRRLRDGATWNVAISAFKQVVEIGRAQEARVHTERSGPWLLFGRAIWTIEAEPNTPAGFRVPGVFAPVRVLHELTGRTVRYLTRAC